MKKLILVFLLGFFSSLLAQDACGGYEYADDVFMPKAQSCTKNSSTYLDKYRYQSTYKPKGHAFIDEVIIPINIIVLCDDNGDYGAYTPTSYNAVLQKEFWLNRAYQRTSEPSDPVTGYGNSYWLSTTKISFEINQVYFYNNSTYFNATTPDTFINHHFSTVPTAKNVINCFIVKNIGVDAGGFQSIHTPTNTPITVSKGRKSENMTGEWLGSYWYWAEHLPHELGHALGLNHTYQQGGCCSESSSGIELLEDVFFTPFQYEQPCPNNDKSMTWDSPTDFCTNNLMSGNKENVFISPLQAGRMHRQLRMGNIRNFAYGYSSFPHNITNNEIWDFTYKSYNDIIVKQGATLTIQCRLEMVKEAKVIIEPGAKLIVDGGIITSSRSAGSTQEGFWQGVEVWGTTSQHQFPEYNPTYQGRLELINGGTIENAHLAATNWKPDDYSKIGGVIFSNGGVFKNNRKDVAFIKYENFSPSNPSNKISDHSGFSNTDFTWDSDYLNLGLPVHPHVTLWNVHGVGFTNCHFSNTRPKSLFEATASKAIYSIDASYTVGAGCSSTFSPCPSGNLLKSTFTGYSVAIEATGAGTSKAITVAQSNFTNNIVGITVDAFNNVSFNRNTISIGTGGYPIVLNGTGISIDNSTGYIVEENTITKTLPNTTTGIYVNNSGTANNRLYKNTLTGLTTGNNLTKINKNLILWGTHTGLQFLCNTYTNNNIAVRVGPSSDVTYGVKVEQGTANQSAGNVFNSNTNSINNISEWSFNYYHNGGATQPIGYSPTNKVTLYTATANSCPSSFGGLILFGMKPGGALDSLENEQQNYKTAYNDLYYNYLSLIDDGNTEALKSKVSNSWSEDVWKLRGNLLEKSPYLSQEVLLETAKLGTLPNAMLLEICLANPDVTKNVYFVNKLDETTNGTFPSYMYSYLLNNDKKTTRTQLEGEMTAIQAELSTTNHFIANITATADEYSYENTYNTIIRAGNDLSDRINLMDFFIEHNQWSKADSVLQSIQMDKKMQENLLLIEDFDQYIAFRSNLGVREISQLNDNEIEFLQKLAEKDGRVSGYARNILCFFYNVCYDRNREDEAQKMMLQEPTMLAPAPALETIMYSLNVYPNPAKEFVNLQWEILDELQNCHYKIVDLSGIIVSEGIISENKNEQTIDTRNLREGVYLISIYNNDEVKVSKKLVVQKQN